VGFSPPGDQARRGQSQPEAESLWPQSSDNSKARQANSCDGDNNNAQCYGEIVTKVRPNKSVITI